MLSLFNCRLCGNQSGAATVADGSIPQVQAMGKRPVARRGPHRRSPATAVPRTAAIRASAVVGSNDCLVPVSVSSLAGGHRRQPLHCRRSPLVLAIQITIVITTVALIA